MPVEPPPPAMTPAPSRQRGLTIIAVGAIYALATITAGAWLTQGWIRWAVIISGLGAGSMLMLLGGYIVRTADTPPS